MRIAMVSETWAPEVNGVALTVANLAGGLRREGHSVDVVRPRQLSDSDVENDDTVLVRGARIPRYPGLQFGLPASRRLTSAWKSRRPDAIYVATEGPLGWSALRVARRLGIVACSGFHTRFDEFARHYGLAALESVVFSYLRYFHNLGAATLAPTRELQKLLLTKGINNAVLLERAVDTTQFTPNRRDPGLRAQWGVSDADLVVGYVGRIAPEKNLAVSVRAFREIQKTHPSARYVFVGDGPARAVLERDNPDFIFVGVKRGVDLARHFASSDLFLFPSLSETFGNVTLEALASGVPTVAFDYAAARDYVDASCGQKVAFGNADDFVRASAQVADTPSLRSTMRGCARDKVRQLEPQTVAAQFSALLTRLLHTTTARNSASTDIRV